MLKIGKIQPVDLGWGLYQVYPKNLNYTIIIIIYITKKKFAITYMTMEQASVSLMSQK